MHKQSAWYHHLQDLKSRLHNKLEILRLCQSLGIWLVDANVFGWYISQKIGHTHSKNTNEVHKKSKDRPPSNLKNTSIAVSWEMFTKHLVHDVAREGHLKFVVTIGKDVGKAISLARLEEAVANTNAEVNFNIPQPNCQKDGGHDDILEMLCTKIEKYITR